jgi:hypothetical protein
LKARRLGPGGIFSPSLYVGATLGGAWGQALAAVVNSRTLVQHHFDPIKSVVAGMAGMVGGSTGASITCDPTQQQQRMHACIRSSHRVVGPLAGRTRMPARASNG